MDTEGGGKLRVLVVEDEPIARELLADLLTMAGYDVVSARTGEQGLLTLIRERGRFDCLFTAIELPGLVDGWMLADEFRVVDPARPVVFATASAERARRRDGEAFVACPVLPPTAVEAVKAVTGRGDAALRARSARPRANAEPAPVMTETGHEADPAIGLLRAAG